MLSLLRSIPLRRVHPAWWVFGAMLLWTVIVQFRSPIGPGQDHPYHMYAASIFARSRAEGALSMYYPGATELSSNVLLYYVAIPFVKLFGPLYGMTVTLTIMYFAGYPLACAFALRTLGRSPWGAIVAFPVLFNKSWSQGGFLPFLSIAPLMVLSIALYSRSWNPERTLRQRATDTAITAVLAVLGFFAHSHAFVFLGCSLGILTVTHSIGALFETRHSLRTRFALALAQATAAIPMILPSALLGYYWPGRRAVGTTYPLFSWHTLEAVNYQEKLQTLWITLTHLPTKYEVLTVGVIFTAIVVVLVLAPRPTAPRAPFETTLAFALGTFLILPDLLNGQAVATRHIDFALWMLPMVLIPFDSAIAAPSTEPRAADENAPRITAANLKVWALIAFVVVASIKRTSQFHSALESMRVGYTAPLLRVAQQCRSTRAATGAALPRIGHMLITQATPYFHSTTLNQAHLTVAAICALDAETFGPDTVVPLRYQRVAQPFIGAVIAPIDDWATNDGVWVRFDYVLATIEPSPPTFEGVDGAPRLVARHGPFALFRTTKHLAPLPTIPWRLRH